MNPAEHHLHRPIPAQWERS